MPWDTPARTGDATGRRWMGLRKHVLKRDPQCQLAYDGCTGRSTEVDHIVSVKHGGIHDPSNLRGVCTSCHGRRTQGQAQAARGRRERPAERHPGLV